jgi:inward rectifier potassium channel
VEVKVTPAISTEENGRLTDKFYTLPLEMSKIEGMALSWTLVHPITADSPFAGLTKEDIASTDIEVMVFLKAFDTVFSNTVVSRTSYISSEIKWGAKFRLMYHPNTDKSKTILNIDQLNDYDLVDLPPAATEPIAEIQS